jgi:hypothetical protein
MIARRDPTMKRTVIYVLILALLAGSVIVAWRRACAAARRTKYVTDIVTRGDGTVKVSTAR